MSIAPTPSMQQLSDAARLMQLGRYTQAREILQNFVRTNPGVGRAHWLLGGALLNSGDPVGAERALHVALDLEPGNPSSLALLGEVLSAQGRFAEAEASLKRALAIEPRLVPAAANLAQVLLAEHRASDALQFLDGFIRKAKATPALLLLRAHALLSMQEYANAIPAFRQAIAAAPNDRSAHLGLAAALVDSGQHTAAEATIRQVIGHGPGDPQSRFVLARALLGERRLDEAEAEFRTAIRMRPDYLEAHVNLAETLWMRSGDAKAAVTEIDATLRATPALSPLLLFKANLLDASGDSAAALEVLDQALAKDNGNFALHLAASQTAIKTDPAKALTHAEHAYRLGNGNQLSRGVYGNALLAAGHPDRAQALVDNMLANDPDDGLALALQATAWRMLDDPRYHTHCDYAQFVRPSIIDTPDGWPDLQAYLGDLAQGLLKLHTYHAHPIGQSLRNGTQADLSLEHAPDPAIRAFAQAIDGPIRRYMQDIGHGNDPVRRRNTDRYELSGIWSVRLRPHGYHFNHFHPEGWLSSACYIDIPATLGRHNGEGWLQFGSPAFATTPPTPAEYFVRPEPGLLVLFPAWFWHGTIPFSGGPDDSRLTIAFDIIPA